MNDQFRSLWLDRSQENNKREEIAFLFQKERNENVRRANQLKAGPTGHSLFVFISLFEKERENEDVLRQRNVKMNAFLLLCGP